MFRWDQVTSSKLPGVKSFGVTIRDGVLDVGLYKCVWEVWIKNKLWFKK